MRRSSFYSFRSLKPGGGGCQSKSVWRINQCSIFLNFPAYTESFSRSRNAVVIPKKLWKICFFGNVTICTVGIWVQRRYIDGNTKNTVTDPLSITDMQRQRANANLQARPAVRSISSVGVDIYSSDLCPTVGTWTSVQEPSACCKRRLTTCLMHVRRHTENSWLLCSIFGQCE